MVRRGMSVVLTILVALAIAIPAMAKDAGANNAKPTKTTMEFLNSVTVGGKQLKPGNYVVIADDTKLTIEQSGKVVAEAPVQWKDETKRSRYSNIVSDGDQLKEIHFGGQMRYIVITS